MDLERSFQDWHDMRASAPGQAHRLIAETAGQLKTIDSKGITWLSDSLNDEERKFFTAAVYSETSTLPDGLFEPMLRAAVYEQNPLQAHAFVEPCLKSFGSKRVLQTLLKYLEHGSDYEKAGAVNALHWAGDRKPSSESGINQHVDVELMRLKDHKQKLYLQTFIHNKDVDLRRSLISNLELDQIAPSITTKEMIDQVVKIARAHPDQYIRYRVEVQLGRAPSQYPLPPRKKSTQIISRRGWWKQLWK